MAQIRILLSLLLALALLVPLAPPAAEAATEQSSPPHYRRSRRPPPPPSYRVPRARPAPRVIHHYHQEEPSPVRRPRQPIDEPRTSVYVGIGALANIVFEGEDRVTRLINTGGGLDVFLGFRFHPIAAIELGGVFSFHEMEPASYATRTFERGVLAGVTGDLKLFFLPSSRRIEPFVQIGGGGYMLNREGFENQLAGGGFQVGGGVDIRLSRMFAIGTRILYRGLFLDNADDSYWYGDPYQFTYMSVLTVSANLQFHF